MPMLLRPRIIKGADVMGATFVTVAIRNPAERERVWEGEFLVNSGAVNCQVPRQHLEAIGLVPGSQRTRSRADGSETVIDIAGAQIEFLDEVTWGNVIFGPDDSLPLLGSTALQSVGAEIDPHSETLKKLSSVPLPGYWPVFR